MKPAANIFLFVSLLIYSAARSQSHYIDSLKSEMDKTIIDSVRCKILGWMIESEKDATIWSKYNNELLHLTEKHLSGKPIEKTEARFYKTYYAEALNNKGLLFDNEGQLLEAAEFYMKSIAIRKELGDKNGLAAVLNNLAFVYNNQGDIPKALGLFDQSLKLLEETNDQEGIAQSLNNLGYIYENQGETKKALDYYLRSLRLKQEMNADKQSLAVTLNNIGTLYKDLGEIDMALDFHYRTLKLRQEAGDSLGIAYSLANIAFIFDYKNQWTEAQDSYQKALAIFTSQHDRKGESHTLINIAELYYKRKNYTKAIDLGKQSLRIAKEISYPENIANAANSLSYYYMAGRDFKSSLENYELYIRMRDSIKNESTRKAAIRSQLKYEYEKKAAEDSVARAKEKNVARAILDQNNAELKLKKDQQYVLFGGLSLLLIFSGFIYNRFKLTKKQKHTIEAQKSLVEEQKKLVEIKQKEVLDSIRYAKRIQMAQIPSDELFFKKIKSLNS